MNANNPTNAANHPPDTAERPTPITDAATSDCVCNSCDERDVVPRKVALELERQLAEARETIAMYRESKASLPEYSSQRELRRQLAEVTKQRDTLAEAIKNIGEGNMLMCNSARLALAAMKGADAADSSAPVSKNLDTI